MTQYIGLSPAARDFLKINETKVVGKIKTINTYNDGRVVESEEDFKESLTIREDSGECTYGMFEEEKISLFKYTTDSGKVYTEYVQDDPWSSGPCIFIALKDESGNIVKESLWPEEEIENA